VKTIFPRLTILVALLSMAICVAACTSPPPIAQQPPTSTSLAPADFDADDVAFALHMAQYLQQSIDLASLAPDRTSDAQLVDLAAQLLNTQNTAMMTLRALSVQWTENPEVSSGGDVHPDSKLQGMANPSTVSSLTTLTGSDFDRLWLDTMIAGERGSVAMANAEMSRGANSDGIILARSLLDGAQSRIGSMTELRQR
jgi:uncharacterized protein (DUF305 family)